MEGGEEGNAADGFEPCISERFLGFVWCGTLCRHGAWVGISVSMVGRRWLDGELAGV